MNKILFFILIFCFKLNAANTPEVVIILESINKRGEIIKKEVLLIKDSQVFVNREKLSPSETITQSYNIKKISHFLVSEIGTQCESGKFRHLLKNGKELKEEYGCLESTRFHYLEKSFKGLKKDHVTE